jgi:hypothetical protein
MEQFPNVVSVGAGFRSRRDQPCPLGEICLRFLVKRKWKTKRRRHDAIPARIRTVIKVAGKRAQVSIPTDVSEFQGGTPHAALELTDGIISRTSGIPSDRGCACCVVRNVHMLGERYLLSCYHVFARNMGNLPPNADCVDATSGSKIGSLIRIADPYDTHAPLDAVLVLLDNKSVSNSSSWGAIALTKATAYDVASLHPGKRLSIFGLRSSPATPQQPAQLRGSPIDATFQSIYPNPIPFDYRATVGRYIYFADTIEYLSSTRLGDSGAALMDDSGKLYGMHFYGHGNIGYAFASPLIFDSGAFQIDITL